MNIPNKMAGALLHPRFRGNAGTRYPTDKRFAQFLRVRLAYHGGSLGVIQFPAHRVAVWPGITDDVEL